MKHKFSLEHISLFLALLFHVCGVIGILFSPYKAWFVSATPITILLMFVLVIINQKHINQYFIYFLVFVFVTGMLLEMTGVNTGLLFGDYFYGTVLGTKLNNVPLLIGINWFTTIYCVGCLTHAVEEKFISKASTEVVISPRLQTVSFIIDAALLTTLFDWIMEPVAIKLEFWQWRTLKIPQFNYLCWFAASLLLQYIFRKMPFNKNNMFAIHLLAIEALFFLILRTFL